MIGNDFAKLAVEACGVSSLEAKVILYRVLTNSSAKHFDDIFDSADRDDPSLVLKIGSPMFTTTGKRASLAQKFISKYGLDDGSTKESLFTDDLSDKLEPYENGALGAKFLEEQTISADTQIVALRFLAESLACPNAEDYVFTAAQKRSSMYQLIDSTEHWQKLVGLTTSTINALRGAAHVFLDKLMGGFDDKYLNGLTFGWMSEDKSEWHLFGDIMDTLVFRANKAAVPSIFGAANFEVPKKSLEMAYNSTFLCSVTMSREDMNAITMGDRTFMYTTPMSKLKGIKWLGTLPSVLGSWAVVRKSILKGYEEENKEET